ncbi:TetR/AcrR family transcriptional regulator [Bryobacter aggregatus]|uniref:TetR/AcrR family transcriptional regulator n=1 Tax=Bryobacter aggregatus TaxID=360054 RepID=UPI00068EE875|nr:TetR/AcrR family transcriptional regulator [Bryobacter aggregatus]
MPFPAKTEAAAILQAALAIVEQQGWESLSMRNIAASLGVRASSLYHHYADRAALESALGALATRSLLEAMQSAKGLKAMSLAYIRFAQENQSLYQLITIPNAQPESKEIWNVLLAAIAKQNKTRRDHTPAILALWSYLHGYVTLERAGQFGTANSQLAFEKGLSALLKSFA